MRWNYRKLVRKITHKPIGNDKYYPAKKQMCDVNEQSDYIYELLKDGKPCMLCRYGASETRAVIQYEHPGCIGFEKQKALDRLCSSSGFFPKKKELMYRFAELMEDCSSEADFIGVWYIMQDYLVDTYAKQAVVGNLAVFDVWTSDRPWTRILEGKKVVVVHPFSVTIRSQYDNNREKLFENPDVLPKFELRTVRTPVTLNNGDITECDGCKDWFEVLDRLYEEVMSEDFDIALLGCGAYGFPLAAKIKRAGKQAVHFGGSLQLLFGINGKRWAEGLGNPYANEYWTFPFDEDTPTNGKLAENGCYWK